jgi:hypothetical protein
MFHFDLLRTDELGHCLTFPEMTCCCKPAGAGRVHGEVERGAIEQPAATPTLPSETANGNSATCEASRPAFHTFSTCSRSWVAGETV